MSSTYSVARGKAQFPKLVEQARSGPLVSITDREGTVAYVVGRERMEAIVETIEILGNIAAANAIRDHKAGKTRFGRIEDIPQ